MLERVFVGEVGCARACRKLGCACACILLEIHDDSITKTSIVVRYMYSLLTSRNKIIGPTYCYYSLKHSHLHRQDSPWADD